MNETAKHKPKQSRKGQTMLEFAVTLPAVLVLMFGIIEFGRIFQAWIAIQNAARIAVRYASTGEYMREFDDLMNPLSFENGANDPNSIVTCTDENDGTTLPIRSKSVTNNANFYRIQRYDDDNSRTHSEELFATWWNQDCNPKAESADGQNSNTPGADQFLRIDLLRIPSIINAAQEGAGGLTRNPVDIDELTDPAQGDILVRTGNAQDYLRDYLYSVWHPRYPMFLWTGTDTSPTQTILQQRAVPLDVHGPDTYTALDPYGPDETQNPVELQGYFSVMICSNRDMFTENGETSWIGNTNSRYITLFSVREFEETVSRYGGDPTATAGPENDLRTSLLEGGDLYNRYTDMPGCFMNAVTGDGLQHQGIRWLDPGGPGDRVDVAISFYHPLITPLGLANFLPMHSRRAAVVESFRSAGAPTGDPETDPDLQNLGDDDDEEPINLVPSETPLPTSTFTPTHTPTATPTQEELSFSCDAVELVDVDFNVPESEDDRKIAFQSGRVVFTLRNNNNIASRLIAVNLNWSSPAYDADPNLDPVPGYPGFHMDRFNLAQAPHWDGQDFDPETNTEVELGDLLNSRVFELPPNGQTVRWSAVYQSGPSILSDVLPRSAFNGTSFRFRDPLTGQDCPNELEFSSTNNTVDPDTPVVVDPEVDCASATVEFGFTSFRDNGWVQMYIQNLRDVPAPVRGFEAQWGPWEDRAESGSVLLQGVYIGGATPPEGTQIWSSGNTEGIGMTQLTNNTGTLEDPNDYDPVVGGTAGGAGTWVIGGTFDIPPRTTINAWFDFNGNNLSSGGRNMIVSDLNGSKFVIGCPVEGGGDNGGPGTVPEGEITLINYPAPEPTIDNRNDPPIAQDDTYTVTNRTSQFSVGNANNGVLRNDTDCMDDTVNRGTQGTVCTDINNPTDNGDNPLQVSSGDCLDNNGCRTDRGGRLYLNTDGTFTYDPTSITNNNFCEGNALTDTFQYQIEDARGGKATAIITFDMPSGSGGNRRPVAENGGETFFMSEGQTELRSNQARNIDYFFDDPDNDNLTYSLRDVSPGNNSTFDLNNNGTWTYNPPNSLLDKPRGTSTTVTIKIRADDGGDVCNRRDNTFNIVVPGTADPDPEPPPPSDEDDGFSGSGSGSGG